MLIAGLDEAGRGPVIGSLVIGCVICDDAGIERITQLGVNDSKQLSPKRREELSIEIKKIAISFMTLDLSASQLNELHYTGLTLNQIEERSFAKILNEITPKPDIVYLDAADVKEERFGQSIQKLMKYKPKEMISKHKGDSIFKIVGAASILAKTRRDQIITELKQQYGELGSGYPSDPNTINYLKQYYRNHQDFPPIVRRFWGTILKIEKELAIKPKVQKKLTDF